MALAGKDVIWRHGCLQFADPLQGAFKGTSGIHRPDSSGGVHRGQFRGKGGNTPAAGGYARVRVPSKSVLSSLIIGRLSPPRARHGNQEFVPVPQSSWYREVVMKSAYELAMSRLEKSAPSRVLTEEQKAAISEIDSEYDAKVAEKKIFLESEIAKSQGDPLAVESLRKQLASELAAIEEKREERKQGIRQVS